MAFLAPDFLSSTGLDLLATVSHSVGGNGYGRVDVRMDKDSQELFVLEVNAKCGISSDDQTSVGNILRFSGTPFAQLMSEMLVEAFDRHSTKSQ